MCVFVWLFNKNLAECAVVIACPLGGYLRRTLPIRYTVKWGALVSAGPHLSPEVPPIRYSSRALGSTELSQLLFL